MKGLWQVEKQNRFVSILISCYNYQDYVERCLDSCKKQTFQDFEIIIVDDASGDNSAEVIEEYIEKNKNLKIKFIGLEKNGGPAVAKGTALSYATGEYVIFIDCDDWMDENCLSVLAERAKKTGADKIRAQVRTVEEDTGKIIRERKIPETTNKWAEGMMAATLLNLEFIKKNKVSFLNDRYVSDDLFFIAQINAFANKTEYIRETVYNISYKAMSDSGVGNFKKAKKLEYAYHTNEKVKNIYDQLDSKNKIGCEYLFAKQYFFLLLQFSRMLEFQEIKGYHRDLRATIDPFFPKFYKNKNIKVMPNGDPLLFRCVMKICALAENFNLMVPMLKVYWLLARKFNFITR